MSKVSEAEIMELVWSQGWDDFSVQDVVDGLSGRRELAYTTLLTTVRLPTWRRASRST